MAVLHILFVIASLLCLTAGYELKTTYNVSNFFDDSSFQFYDGYDKFTDGLALYVPKTEATSLGLARYQDDQVYIGVDNTSILNSATAGPGKGRKSVRLEGVQTFDNGLIILDLGHLPGGCGLWTTFSLSEDNLDCVLVPTGPFWASGINSTAGTPDEFPNTGGFWAIQIEDDGIKGWSFARGFLPSSNIASDNPDPRSWGTPDEVSASGSCSTKAASRKLKLVINFTFCGSNYESRGSGSLDCAASTGVETCGEYVANTPSAFTEAYFLINHLKFFKHDAGEISPDNSPVSATAGTTLTPIYRDQIRQSTSYVFQTSIVTKTVTKTLTMIRGIIKYTPDSESSTKETTHTPTSATASATTTEHASVTPMYRTQIPQSTSVVYQTTIFTKIVTMTMTTIGGKPGYTDIESWTTSSTSTKSTRTTPMWTFPNPNRPSSSTKTKTATASSATASPTTTGIRPSTPVWSLPDRPQQPPSSLRR